VNTIHRIEFTDNVLAGHIVVSDAEYVELSLRFFMSDRESESGYLPAKSFMLYGRERLELLRDALVRVLGEGTGD
jgi:hypothetical protein